MEIRQIATFHSPVGGKFGLPRQSGVVRQLQGTITFEPQFKNPDALRGMDGFDYIWLIWGFSLNRTSDNPTVRPPRLGGNERIGVFASRSPFRPNSLGLSSVRIESVDFAKCEIHVSGADLADGTPIYDIKPYVTYCDSHECAASGFVDANEWHVLEVKPATPEVAAQLESAFNEKDLQALTGILQQDPRPQYEDNPQKKHGLMFSGHDVQFHVADGTAYIDSIISL